MRALNSLHKANIFPRASRPTGKPANGLSSGARGSFNAWITRPGASRFFAPTRVFRPLRRSSQVQQTAQAFLSARRRYLDGYQAVVKAHAQIMQCATPQAKWGEISPLINAHQSTFEGFFRAMDTFFQTIQRGLLEEGKSIHLRREYFVDQFFRLIGIRGPEEATPVRKIQGRIYQLSFDLTTLNKAGHDEADRIRDEAILMTLNEAFKSEIGVKGFLTQRGGNIFFYSFTGWGIERAGTSSRPH